MDVELPRTSTPLQELYPPDEAVNVHPPKFQLVAAWADVLSPSRLAAAKEKKNEEEAVCCFMSKTFCKLKECVGSGKARIGPDKQVHGQSNSYIALQVD